MAKSETGTGIGLWLLGIAFIVLKLTGYIDWSWWWATLPLWGGLAVVIVGLIIYLLYKVIRSTLKKRR